MSELINVREVAEILGYSRSGVHGVKNDTDKGFPPYEKIGGECFWDKQAIIDWGQANPKDLRTARRMASIRAAKKNGGKTLPPSPLTELEKQRLRFISGGYAPAWQRRRYAFKKRFAKTGDRQTEIVHIKADPNAPATAETFTVSCNP